jgi:transposase InsO family protein
MHSIRGTTARPAARRNWQPKATDAGANASPRLRRTDGLRGLCARRFVPCTTGPNQTWVTDLTYVWTAEGWLYVAVMLDLWHRDVVGWAAAATLHTPLASRAAQMALQHRRPPHGLWHHSDRGVPYASGEYRALLLAAGLTPSMSRAGNPLRQRRDGKLQRDLQTRMRGPGRSAGRCRHAGRSH